MLKIEFSVVYVLLAKYSSTDAYQFFVRFFQSRRVTLNLKIILFMRPTVKIKINFIFKWKKGTVNAN